MKGSKLDLTGMRRGSLVADRPAGYHDKRGNAMWICKCDCGKEHVVRAWHFQRGQILSCGCSRQRQPHKYGDTATRKMRIYKIFAAMKQRCYNEKCAAYRWYGGREITVCDKWLNSFEAFFRWAMQNGYKDNLTIDRIDVNGDYSPENCRWATRKEQANNTRANHIITYRGKTMTLMAWARHLNVEYGMLRSRLKYGWSIERTLTEPPHKNNTFKRRIMKNEQNTLAQNTF